MKPNNDTPSIRFAGFTDAWEQREVGELLTERNEQSPKSEDYPLMAFIAYEGVAPKGERYDRSSLVNDTENKLYKHTEKGDFIYSSNNLETGSIGLNNYGNACISPVYSIFSCTELSIPDFIGRRLCRKDFISEMVKWRQGVIYGQWRIHEDDFVKIKIEVPTVQEQKKIGQLLLSLDTLITLHQRKYDQLVNIKKSMLEKMFPKSGELVPEVRFAGFTDAWEQREFGETFTFLQNNTLSRVDLADSGDGTRNIHYGDILVKFGECINIATASLPIITNESVINKYRSSFLKNGDIVIADTAEDETVGKCAEIIEEKGETIISGLHTIPCRPTCDFAGGFLGYYMNSSSFHDQLIPLMQGIKVTSISKSALQTTMVQYPQEKEEQAQIGRMFQNLDDLITLHQRRLERLQNIKKACLEKMFV